MRTRSRVSFLLLLSFGALVQNSAAQTSGALQNGSAPLRDDLAHSGPADAVWLGSTEGGFVGFGPGYDVRFLSDEVQLAAAGSGEPVGLSLESVRLGDRELFRSIDGAPARVPCKVENSVRYEVSEWGYERYTLTPRGLKHDLVLEHLPEKRGELLLRLSASDESGVAADRLEFGPVLAWDATGRCVEGTLRRDAQGVEFTLPAAFVETAVAPLVVDPLILAPIICFSPVPGESVSADVSYSSQYDVYGVAWTRRLPDGTGRVFFQVFDYAGFSLVYPFEIASTSASGPWISGGPRAVHVTDILDGSLFVVAIPLSAGSSYGSRVELRGIGYDVASGTWKVQRTDSTYAYLTGASIDLGGGIGPNAMLALEISWRVEARSIGLDPQDEGGFLVGEPQVLAGQGLDEYWAGSVTISRGSPWLVMWEAAYGESPVSSVTEIDLWGALVDEGGVRAGPEAIRDKPGVDEGFPDAAGEGQFKAFVYREKHEGVVRVMAQQFIWDFLACPSGSLCIDTEPIEIVQSSIPMDMYVSGPSIGQTADWKFFVVWTQLVNGSSWKWDHHAISLDYWSFAPCEAAFPFGKNYRPWAPRVSDNPNALASAGLAVWVGQEDYGDYPTDVDDTWCGLLRACE